MKISFIIVGLGWLINACGQKNIGQPTFGMYSNNVKDSFDIFITLPKNYKENEKYSVFYYLDANIKSGNKIREILRDSTLKPNFEKTIFVGIGHKGDFHKLRRRDFIVPQIEGSDTLGLSENFGQIGRFYHYMKSELIPYINKHYNTKTSDNSLLGHSFGGLFTIYSLLQNDTIFRYYYALSPSLWVSSYSIYKFNKIDPKSNLKRDLFFCAGSFEIFNRIKAGSDELYKYLQSKKYPELIYQYKIYKGENHNSAVPYAIRDILCRN